MIDNASYRLRVCIVTAIFTVGVVMVVISNFVLSIIMGRSRFQVRKNIIT